MLKIILSRTGKKKQAYFRILVTQKEKDPWGSFIENLGNYNPRSKELEIKADRIKYWISQGAAPSETVWNMLIDKGLVEGKKKKVSKISQKRAAKIAEKSAAAKDKSEAEKKTAESAPAPEAKPEVKAEEPKAEVKVEEPKKEIKTEEPKPEAKADEPKAE